MLMIQSLVHLQCIFLDKGLGMNAGKSKVMVGSSSRKMIVYSEKWAGVQANSEK